MTIMSNRDTSTLPKWAQALIRDLESRVEHAEATIPWTKPGMEWLTVMHPDLRAKDNRRCITLFALSESRAQPIVTIGPEDAVFIGRASRKSTQPDKGIPHG